MRIQVHTELGFGALVYLSSNANGWELRRYCMDIGYSASLKINLFRLQNIVFGLKVDYSK